MRNITTEPLSDEEKTIIKSIEISGTYSMGPGETNKELFDKLEREGIIQSKSSGFGKQYSLTEEWINKN